MVLVFVAERPLLLHLAHPFKFGIDFVADELDLFPTGVDVQPIVF